MKKAVNGLSGTEAELRLRAEGYNEMPRAGQRTVPRIALEVLREPMFGLLIAQSMPARMCRVVACGASLASGLKA